MAMIIGLILNPPIPYMDVINQVLIYIALILTIISMIDYIKKNYKVFLEGSLK